MYSEMLYRKRSVNKKKLSKTTTFHIVLFDRPIENIKVIRLNTVKNDYIGVRF